MMHKAWSGIEEVPYSFSRSSVKFEGHTALKIVEFDPNWASRTVTPVWIHQWLRNDAQSLKYHRRGALLFLAATKQLYEWYFLSVCPSVRLSVRLSVCLSVRLSVCPSVTPFWLCSHHRIIMKFSGVITLDQGKVHAKGQGQRSKVKVTEVTTQIFVSGL